MPMLSVRSWRRVVDPRRLAPIGLGLILLLVYAKSLSGGFLNYDDPWLIRDNPLLATPTLTSLGRIWLGFDLKTRLILGAEYLPLRDTSLWLESRLHHLNPHWLRATNLLLYVGACVLLRSTLRSVERRGGAAEVAAWIFALHPVHVESVAWLAARKDVLALFFLAAAWRAYVARGRAARLTPLLLLAAVLSKGHAVVGLPLLLVLDWHSGRRSRWAVVAGSLAAILPAIAVHLWVGGLVGMRAAFPGGSRWTTVMTMGPVWIRYLLNLLLPARLSILQEVSNLGRWTWASVSGYTVLVIWLLFSLHAWRRSRRLPLLLLLWYVVPLSVVSQYLYPLQNTMADRYAWISVLAVGLAFGQLCQLPKPIGYPLIGAALCYFGAWTFHRASLFRDSVSVFESATRTVPASRGAWYQLAKAYQEEGDLNRAEVAYRTAMNATMGREEASRRAALNLSNLYCSRRDRAPCLDVLQDAARRWPDEPKVLLRLARALDSVGKQEEAQKTLELYHMARRRGPKIAEEHVR